MMRSITPSSRWYGNVTVWGGPVGVPLPIGGTSAILGVFDDRAVPSLVSEAEGGEAGGGVGVGGPVNRFLKVKWSELN
jgi:hypothetical protein